MTVSISATNSVRPTCLSTLTNHSHFESLQRIQSAKVSLKTKQVMNQKRDCLVLNKSCYAWLDVPSVLRTTESYFVWANCKRTLFARDARNEYATSDSNRSVFGVPAYTTTRGAFHFFNDK